MVAERVRIRACEGRLLDRFSGLGSAQHADYCRAQFARGAAALTILVADDGAAPVAKLHLDFEARASEREAVPAASTVVPELQSRGIGTALMAAAEELVCNRGYRAIVLAVEDWNPRARRLYERLGYEAFATDDFKYDGAPVPNPGVWMRKELDC